MLHCDRNANEGVRIINRRTFSRHLTVPQDKHPFARFPCCVYIVSFKAARDFSLLRSCKLSHFYLLIRGFFSHHPLVLSRTARAFSKLNPFKIANGEEEKTRNLRNQQSLLFLIESMMVIMKNKEI
jgi:hypothetical protein